ncbi:MAG: hypothetical protein C0621_09135 [Desulfuromonas sp.]|nr:MAG: hypothetical protein C0621_09135 [Desulfuromonas sp.]
MIALRTLLNICVYSVSLLGVAPLYLYLEPLAQIVLPLAWGAGLIADIRKRPLVPPLPATLISILVFFYYAFQISRTTLVEPVTNILALLLVIRLITAKNSRNYLQIFVLSLFALASSTLLTLSLAFFIFLLLQVGGITSGLLLLSFFHRSPELQLRPPQLRTLLRPLLLLPLGSLLLMFLFFAILPRTQRPLWDFLNPAGSANTGFSERVAPGTVSSMSSTRRMVLRVEGPRQATNDLYWRGIVLNRPVGGSWIRAEAPEESVVRLQGDEHVELTYYPEPGASRYLPTLDTPERVTGFRTRAQEDLIFTQRGHKNQRISYRGISRPGAIIITSKQPESPFWLATGTVSPRLRQTAEELKNRGDTPSERLAALDRFFLAQELTFSVEELSLSDDPVDDFLFVSKRGYCEFFASAYATLLRLLDIPARLVGGYYGGEYNELGGYYRINESMAHVWVEAYLPHGGWQRIDPSLFAVNAEESSLNLRNNALSWSRQMADNIDYLWNKAVITYDFEGQITLARRAGEQLQRFEAKSLLEEGGKGGVVLALVVGGAIFWFILSRRRETPRQRLLHAYLKLLRRRHGITIHEGEKGLLALAKELKDSEAIHFAQIYSANLYRDRPLDAATTAALRDSLRRMRRHKG